MKKKVKNIFLGGGAFGCVYHIGIVQALYKYKMNVNIYGNSAGALIGMFYVLKIPIKPMKISNGTISSSVWKLHRS
jgi:predicted acylesterase/phospholipase RssA